MESCMRTVQEVAAGGISGVRDRTDLGIGERIGIVDIEHLPPNSMIRLCSQIVPITLCPPTDPQ